jgi:tetratricopeptide (TPR) repeat protein
MADVTQILCQIARIGLADLLLGCGPIPGGDFEAALKTGTKSLDVHPTWYGRGGNYIVPVKACQRLGRHDDALNWLEQARRRLEEFERRKEASKLGLAYSDYLTDWLKALALLQEAEATIK